MEKSTEETLNYEQLKESHKIQKKAINTILAAAIRAAPREVVIEILKKQKIIKEDWNPKTDKLELMERKDGPS